MWDTVTDKGRVSPTFGPAHVLSRHEKARPILRHPSKKSSLTFRGYLPWKLIPECQKEPRPGGIVSPGRAAGVRISPCGHSGLTGHRERDWVKASPRVGVPGNGQVVDPAHGLRPGSTRDARVIRVKQKAVHPDSVSCKRQLCLNTLDRLLVGTVR